MQTFTTRRAQQNRYFILGSFTFFFWYSLRSQIKIKMKEINNKDEEKETVLQEEIKVEYFVCFANKMMIA